MLGQRAFASLPCKLNQLKWFHTDRDREFSSQLIDEALDAFDIERSLSEKGSPYDNAVAEVMFKTIKTEFINATNSPCQQALDYLTPVEYKLMHSLKNVLFSIDI